MNMMATQTRKDVRLLKRLGACEDAVKFLKQHESLAEAWAGCERGDWMLWLIGKLSGESGSDERKRLVLAACECARLALPFVQKGETRPLTAIETAEKWARGEEGITLEQVRAAADAAYAAHAAAYAAYAAADAAAAATAADAAYAAYAAADAAYAAADAADAAYAAAAYAAAAYAAYAAASAAKRKEVLATFADIVRRHYPEPPEAK
jgi:hypothetical protein